MGLGASQSHPRDPPACLSPSVCPLICSFDRSSLRSISVSDMKLGVGLHSSWETRDKLLYNMQRVVTAKRETTQGKRLVTAVLNGVVGKEALEQSPEEMRATFYVH